MVFALAGIAVLVVWTTAAASRWPPNPTRAKAPIEADDVTGYGSSQVLLFKHYFPPEASGITRLDADGLVDRSFGLRGTVGMYANDIAVAPDGKILVASDGYDGSDEAPLTRLLPDGQLDPAFGVEGRSGIAPADTWVEGNAVAIMANGDILFAGSRYVPGGEEAHELVAARLMPDGSLDTSFGDDGIAVLVRQAYEETVFSIASTPSGGAVVFGGNEFEGGLWKLNRDGGLDRQFGRHGFAYLPHKRQTHGRFEELMFAPGAVLTPSGKILLAATGSFPLGDRQRVDALRLLPNGHVDRSYGHGGWATEGKAPKSVSAEAGGLTLFPGGVLAVATTFAGGSRREFGAIAFGPGGRLEPGFEPRGDCRAYLPRTHEVLGVADLGGEAVAVGGGFVGEVWVLGCGEPGGR
jgi:uncharacterized delta-60 repeat protein